MSPPTNDADLHRLLADPSRERILRLLRDSGPTDAQHLAAATGLHPTTVRFHVQQLTDAGLVTSAPQSRTTRGRPRIFYTAVPVTDPDTHADEGYRALAEALVGGMAATDTGTRIAINAGRTWGRRHTHDLGDGDGREQLMTLMDRLGFAAEMVDDATILLGHCPLLDVATGHPEVVCSVHLGMLRGALDELGTPLTVASLRPFVEPGLCVVTLAHRDDGADAATDV